MLSSFREYHRRELQIALDTTSPHRLMPELPADAGRVLDIGCGAGQTLMAMDLGGWKAVGIDIDCDALALGKEWSRGITLLSASAERLPFPTQSFDFVVSRVALPYTDIPRSIAEIARVLRPGGSLWLTLHAPSMFRLRNIRSVRSAIYHGYIGLNSLALHWLGRQFRYPLNPQRMESYQTRHGMQRCLARHGLDVFHLLRDERHFLIEARKRGVAQPSQWMPAEGLPQQAYDHAADHRE